MKFDVIVNGVAAKEHRTVVSQFGPLMVGKARSAMGRDAASGMPLE